ncbi:MAG: MotA/TolQ/ExbB proton channel family protein [Kiritimatiellae bacterium]|nr:MotA/TolQ/ExbB proton channel family protein [Kiritimatiellia bacterium]
MKITNIITFEQAWNYGGPLMWVLAFFSVMELTMILYLWVAQRRGGVLKEGVERMRLAKDPAAEGSRIASQLFASVDWLADIAAIAPLVGLLGTVLGMFQAFGGIAADVTAGAKPVVLAQGVSQAIVTTIFGLVVAIPALLFHAIFRRRAARRVAELEEKADEILG